MNKTDLAPAISEPTSREAERDTTGYYMNKYIDKILHGLTRM